MSDINPQLKLERARRQIDAEIERYKSLNGAFPSDDYLSGVIFGLMKARIMIFSTDEQNESWRVRQEMFG